MFANEGRERFLMQWGMDAALQCSGGKSTRFEKLANALRMHGLPVMRGHHYRKIGETRSTFPGAIDMGESTLGQSVVKAIEDKRKQLERLRSGAKR